jgi:hypothetical protein
MKKYTISTLAERVNMTIPETYRSLANLGIIGSPTQHYLTEEGKKHAEEKYIENDRYGRSYWLQVFNSELVDAIKKSKLR